MELLLQRDPTADGVTLGQLFVNGTPFCFTLEDAVRAPGVKVPGQTAIPFGRYRVIVTESQRFGRRLPLVLDVPGFTGIRIHEGNTVTDTSGCILVGLGRTPTSVQSSKAAMARLLPRLEHALQSEDVFLTIDVAPADPLRRA